MQAEIEYTQENQPDGVPPLSLTGERTLPDVPEENYWFQRHLAVYRWIAERVAGLDVVDMACGEGYGTAELARRAARVTGVDANPEAFEHARLKYTRPGVTFERDLVQTWSGDCDAVVFLQTIEHVENPEEVLRHFRSIAKTAYVSTPNVLTLAPEGAEKSGNPWHVKEYRAEEFRALCESVFDHVEIHGLFHARKLWLHERAIAAGWDSVHPKLGITKRFYDWFTPAITDSGLRAARGAARPRARLRSSAQMSRDRGALALVLHTHMPYVEGFGTWPFGEEWLWEAIAGVYVPLLDVLEGAPVTVSLTPVLCDQLDAMRGDPGDRFLRFLREIRAPIHAEDSAGLDATGKPELAAELRRAAEDYVRADEAFERRGRDLLGAFAALGTELWTSTATHAVLPLLATDAGLRMQVGAGVAAHERRFGEGWSGGFWLPECAYEPGLERDLAEHGVRVFCVDQTEVHGNGALEHLEPVATETGPVAVPIDWQTVELVWGTKGYPSNPRYRDYHGRTLHDLKPWTIGGEPYDHAGAVELAREHARDFVTRAVARLDAYAHARGRAGPPVLRARHRAARPLVVRGTGLARGRAGRGAHGRPRPRHAARRA